MRRKSRVSTKKAERQRLDEVEGEPLEPVRIVMRDLTRPDGTTLRVEVPVYPPFKLKQRPPAKSARSRKVRKAS